ncbi:putative DNA metabolism protein [Pedobacter cryoconitis]|uniref:Putative DNA metabolism protein n=1 Tax=Pedobacter cryoconitis TaxID=188932 RepID=A0A7W8ZKR9_9SPHI|nr:TIGR03915 family putative DNA repair protein [Pedobacter cryoconitis]MBB5635702.1 putative DNA metabolism protein [Pedobacter cryoconitis]MBB6273424.1 putative DNA metabolism protein [Pedobacter cryoconitis]
MYSYVFDGSFEGLLCAVFNWFERKPGLVKLQTAAAFQPDAFTPCLHIVNEREKADRVWKGLQAHLSKSSIRKFYCTYLSELDEGYTSLFEFACYLFTAGAEIEKNYGNPHVLALSQIAKKVEREKHRMEAFIRFQQNADGVYYCGIDPDFNVLPLIVKHFKDRYADQQWIIYDIKRDYGLFYDLEKVEEIQIDFKQQPGMKGISNPVLAEKESLYAVLWKDYFKSTNIQARKNTKLHVQHVPKRYWKYLTEKQADQD